jgi:hypothetical protein
MIGGEQARQNKVLVEVVNTHIYSYCPQPHSNIIWYRMLPASHFEKYHVMQSPVAVPIYTLGRYWSIQLAFGKKKGLWYVQESTIQALLSLSDWIVYLKGNFMDQWTETTWWRCAHRCTKCQWRDQKEIHIFPNQMGKYTTRVMGLWILSKETPKGEWVRLQGKVLLLTSWFEQIVYDGVPYYWQKELSTSTEMTFGPDQKLLQHWLTK